METKTMTVEYEAWVDPAELAAAAAEYGSVDGPWCRSCGYRADRSVLAGGCGCPRRSALDGPDDDAEDSWPVIVMEGGPNIVCQSRAERDAVRALIRENGRLAAKDTP